MKTTHLTPSAQRKEDLKKLVPPLLQTKNPHTRETWLRSSLPPRLMLLVAANEMRYLFSQFAGLFDYSRALPYISALEYLADHSQESFVRPTLMAAIPECFGASALPAANTEDFDEPIDVIFGATALHAAALIRYAGINLNVRISEIAEHVVALLDHTVEADGINTPNQHLAQGRRLARYTVPDLCEWRTGWETKQAQRLATDMYEHGAWERGEELLALCCESQVIPEFLTPLRFPNRIGRGLYLIDKLAGRAQEIEAFTRRQT